MKHFALFYDFAPDFREARKPFRGEHLAMLKVCEENGSLVLAGAFADDPPGSMLIFKGEDASVAEDFARNDPYVLNGVAKAWRVREWTTVAGEGALTKVV